MPKPRRDGTDIVYRALTGGCLVTPEQSGQIGPRIASDNYFAQVAIFPKTPQARAVGISEWPPCGKLLHGPIVHDHPSLDRLHGPILESHPSIH
jgi:hypothetical protein